MSINSSLLSRLQQLLLHKKSKKYYCEKLEITEEYLEELLKELRKEDREDDKFCKESKDLVATEEDYKTGSKKITLESDKPLSPKEIEKLAGVDNISTFIDRVWSKSHKNGSWTYSILVVNRKSEYNLDNFTKFLDNWKPLNISINKIGFKNDKETVDVELNIADFHLAKKSFQGDTLESKTFDYYKAVRDLVSKVTSSYNINKLVFPIGNDMFHSDNYQNNTTMGTPQDVTVWYDEEYEKGFELLANSISFLATQAKEVEVILVQGNHDRTKGFFVAHALQVFFSNDKSIKFQRKESRTKHTVLGNTFIGYHHGNKCTLESLPILFATTPEYSKDFGNAKYREIHTGDKHHYLAKEITGSGVRIQQVPSLSGHDRYHVDNGFINQVRAALAFVYHPEQGKIAEFEFRI